MPTKYTVTVDKNNELVYPDIATFATKNELLTKGELDTEVSELLPDLLSNVAIEGLKLKYTGEDGVQRQVNLSVSITKIGEELIPQINLSIVGEED